MGQTIHSEDHEIVYKGTVNINGVSKAELVARARQALTDYVHTGKSDKTQSSTGGDKIISIGSIRLSALNHNSKKVEFLVELNVDKDGYQYKIDSFSLIEKEPGEKAKRTSSEKLLKGMESSGPVAAATEKDLNEIDMNIQKLLDEIRDSMKKPSRSQ